MAKGTPKTFSELNSLFPDNKSGNISPADARDLIATAVNHPDYVPVWPFGSDGTRSERATAVQGAIDHASSEGKAGVLVQDSYLDYDASAVTFDSSVRMIREGQVADVYDVVAYGAAGDGPTGTDDVAAIDACASAADSAGRTYFFHPPGTYTVSVAPTIPTGVVPVGDDASYDGDSTPIVQVGFAGASTTPFQFDPQDIDADAPNWNFTIRSFDVNANFSRNNVVARWGWNVAPGGGQQDASDARLSLDLETFFEGEANRSWVEAHLQYTATDGTNVRPWSWTMDRDDPSQHFAASFHARAISVNDHDGTQHIKMDQENDLFQLFQGVTIDWPSNDLTLLRAREAGGDVAPLMSFNASDRIVMEQDVVLATRKLVAGSTSALVLTTLGGTASVDVGESSDGRNMRVLGRTGDVLEITQAGGSGEDWALSAGGGDFHLHNLSGAIRPFRVQDTAPDSAFEIGASGLVTLGAFGTENLAFVDAGSTGATQQDWVEVTVGGVTGYIRVFASK